MSIYVEYVSRRSAISVEGFHAIVGPGHRNWAAAYPEDRLILNIARTWRLGPEPEYLAIWDVPGAGLERLGEWESIIPVPAARHLEEVFSAVARIDAAGVYQPLFKTIPGTGPIYYAEFFDWAAGADLGAVTAHFERQRDRYADAVLNLAADRVGLLGPDPRGIAFWQVPSYTVLEAIARETAEGDGPILPIRAGVYAEIGHEIL